jgi:uncharacterized protein YndB with AHSA1/START domain
VVLALSRDRSETKHLAHWRGPEELRGEYRGIQRPHRLVSTFVHEAVPEDEAVETLIFDEVDGGTVVTSRSILPSFKARDRYIATGAERGLKESCFRLDQVLNSLIGVGQVA